MSKQISVTLPDLVLRRAEEFARRSGQDLSVVLADAIESSLDPLGIGDESGGTMKELRDEGVLAAADAVMFPSQEQRLTELQARRQAGVLATAEEAELRKLMQLYQDGLLQKSLAIGEAVRRGLRQAPLP